MPPNPAYHIVAVSMPIVYTREGDHDPNGLLFTLKAHEPLLQTVHRLVARRRAPTGLVAVGAAAFLAVWLLAGLGFLLGDLLQVPGSTSSPRPSGPA